MQNLELLKRQSPENEPRETDFSLLVGAALLLLLYLTTFYSYLLFHSLAEIISIVIAFGIFVLAWNSRAFLENNYLLFIGIAYLFTGAIDLIHVLAYKGMNVFKFGGANQPTQLWIAARSLESMSLLIAPFTLGRRMNPKAVFAAYAAVFSFLIWSILASDVFPVAYQEGKGLTPFKIYGEYVISCILLSAAALLYRKRSVFDRKVLTFVLLSIAATIISELAFTFYVGVYDLSNLVGHIFKIIAFYLIYLAVIKTGLQTPFNVFFRSLKQNSEELEQAKTELEQRIKDRTTDLVETNELLRREINAREKAERELRESSAVLRSFYESAPVMMGIVELTDQDEIIHIYDNPRTAEFFGLSAAETRNRPADEIGAPEDAIRTWVAHYRRCLCEGRPVQFEYAHPVSGGSLWLSATVSQLESSSGRPRFSYIAENVTERRKLEAQLRQSQKMEAIGRLAGGVAHDFNNILSAIMGYGHILNKKMRDDDPLRKNVEYLLESAERAALVTRSLLAFSRKQILHRSDIDVNEVIGRVQKYLQRIIGEDIELKTLFRTARAVVNADSSQFEQILVNLAANAHDAMPRGGSLIIATDEVEIDDAFIRSHGYGERGRYVRVSFTDTGTGMDEKTLKNIFEPFFTTKEIGKGTGLGLSIIYGIVKQHRGYIDVVSAPGKGATFAVYLPLSHGVPQQTGAREKEEEEKSLRLGTETILLAEDDSVVRRLTRSVLEDFGFTVIDAVDGEDAVRMYAENRERIHLLLFDVIMPKKSGIEAYEEIRREQPGIKAIFISGYTGNKLPSDSGAPPPGMILLRKPISPRDLLTQVRAVLDSDSAGPASFHRTF